MKSKSISKRNPKQNSDEIQNQFLNQSKNKLQNKFGKNTIEFVAEFQQKYPKIFLGILGETVMEFLIENPEICMLIFDRFLDKTIRKNHEEVMRKPRRRARRKNDNKST